MNTHDRTKAIACAALAAMAITGLAPKAGAGELPLIQDGLVVHLDAADTSTMTMVGDGKLVTEWRSKVGDVKFGLRAGQDETNAPYYQASATCGKIPAVVFGFPTNYAYLATTADMGHTIQTYLTADQSTTNRTVILVAQSLNSSSDYYNGTLFGSSAATTRNIFYMGTYSRGSISANSGSFFGDTGYAWVNGTLKYDLANGLYETYPTHATSTYRRFGFGMTTVANPAIQVLVAQSRTDGTMDYAACLGRAGTDAAHCPMLLSEVIVYDRHLTAGERQYLEEALKRKWKAPNPSVYWTGNGGDNAWETAANWEGGVVPAAGANVCIDANVDVQISGKVDVAEVVLGAGAGVTVNAGATLACGKVLPLAGNAVTVNGLFDYNVAAGKTVTPSAMTLAGAGIVGKRGRGTLVLPANVTLASTLALRADDGLVDLNGADRTFRSVLGGATVTNASDTAITLEIASETTCALEAKLAGNITLKKSGAGELSYAKGQAYAGATILAGGTMKAVKNMAIQTIPGLEIHLDASRADTLTLRDGDNAVLEWRSLTGDGLVYKPPRDYTSHMYFKEGGKWDGDSYYEPTGVASKLPCVRFGYAADGTTRAFGALIAAGYRATTNRTVIIVQQNVVTYGDTLTSFGNYQNDYYPDSGRNRGMIEYDNYSGGRYKQSDWNGKTNDVYFNARQVWSREAYEAGTQPAQWEWGGTSNVDKPSVLSVVVPDDNNWINVRSATLRYRLDTFKTCVGSGQVYHDGGNQNSGMRQYVGRICEVIVFNRALPDAERREIETYLMDKWINVLGKKPYQAGATQFANAPVSKVLTVDAAKGTVVPKLTTIGGITLSDMTLNLMGVDNARGQVLATDTDLTDEFGTVTGLKATHTLTYGAQEVYFRANKGLLMLIR